MINVNEKMILNYVETLKAKHNITILSNASAYLNEYIEEINWVGFYLNIDGLLILGPFQGKVACQEIAFGKGVVGTCATKKEAIIVDNVLEFKGHIACDPNSRSEVVIPVFKGDFLYGILDIDSAKFNRFSEKDVEILKEFVKKIEAILN